MTWGLLGSAGLAAVFYLLQVIGMQSWEAPFGFLADNWYFVLPLIAGFGVQTELYRRIHRQHCNIGGGTLAASGGMSSGAMAACCLHNIVPLVPALGLGGAAAFFSTYQSEVFLVSILAMLLGIAGLFKKYRKITYNG